MLKNDVINEAIKFLTSIEEKNFIKNIQTKELGVSHCVFGHLFINPNSPFYKVGETVKEEGVKINSYQLFPSDLTDKRKELLTIIQNGKHQKYLVLTNNDAPEGMIKESCITWLTNELDG